jgi:AcrR family transcriptional regulator
MSRHFRCWELNKQINDGCKRPYDLGKRSETMDRNRAALLKAAREELEANGLANFTVEALARKVGLSRQTAHNLFGTKSGILEALFDDLAKKGGLTRMPEIMRESSAKRMLAEFVRVFTSFWASDRVLIRRIHGIAVIDPELGASVQARNERRRRAARRVVERLGVGNDTEKTRLTAILYAMTSFEFFDALFSEDIQKEAVWKQLWQVVQRALAVEPGDDVGG